MEEAVGDDESLMPKSKLKPEEGVDRKGEEDHQNTEKEEEARQNTGKVVDSTYIEKGGEEKGTREQEDKKEGANLGGGLINHLINRLPLSIPDDASPAADEASILISIIKD